MIPDNNVPSRREKRKLARKAKKHFKKEHLKQFKKLTEKN